MECDFLILDKPTTSLPADEVERLFRVLRPLPDKGVGMIYVSPQFDDIFQIADRVAVLRDGKMVGMRDIAHTDAEDVVSLILGRKARDIALPDAQDGTEVLTVANLTTRAMLDVSL